MSIQDFALQGHLKVCIFILYMVFLKSECQNWRRPKNKQTKSIARSFYLIYTRKQNSRKVKGFSGLVVELELKSRSANFTAFFFFFLYSWQHCLWIQKTSLSFLFPRVAGNEVKWVGKAETCLMREDFHFVSINICWESGPLLVWDDRDKRTVYVHSIMSTQVKNKQFQLCSHGALRENSWSWVSAREGHLM